MAKGLLKMQVLLWHVELAQRNTVRSRAIIMVGELILAAFVRRTPRITRAEKSGSIIHFAHVGTILTILMASRQANRTLLETAGWELLSEHCLLRS